MQGKLQFSHKKEIFWENRVKLEKSLFQGENGKLGFFVGCRKTRFSYCASPKCPLCWTATVTVTALLCMDLLLLYDHTVYYYPHADRELDREPATTMCSTLISTRTALTPWLCRKTMSISATDGKCLVFTAVVGSASLLHSSSSTW